MALSVTQTGVLAKLIAPGMKVCSFGYPDLIAPLLMIEAMLQERFGALQYREDSTAICARHGLKERQIPDAHSLFSLLLCELDVYDIVRERNCEILCDLNKPFVENPRYDVVLDVGTVEHCFNIGQALINMASLVKLGGVIIHENPFLSGNHGFYGLNPTLFADFYEANGFELEDCRLIRKDGSIGHPPRTQRFKYQGEECNIFALARRTRIQSFVFAHQTKYKNMPAAEAQQPPGEKEARHA